MPDSAFWKLFAGVASDGFEDVPLIPFGRWLLPIGFLLLAEGYCTESNDTIEIFSGYRYGTILNWWRMRFGQGVISGIQKAGLLFAGVFVYDLIMGRTGACFIEENIKIGVLWLLHAISLLVLFLLFHLFFDRKFILVALLLLEGITFTLAYRIKAISHIMYGIWGMYLQSDWRETDGFSTEMVIVAELLLLAAGYHIGRIYLKKRDM